MLMIALASSSAAMLSASTLWQTNDIVIGIAGLVQLVVAGYAIKLSRLFGTARVGWSLFAAFVLLALLHLVQSFSEPSGATEFQINLEIAYALVSMLLLMGMAHLHAVLREEQRVTQAQEYLKHFEIQMRDELELEVKSKTERLTQVVASLQSEIEVRQRAEIQIREQARLLDLAHDAIIALDLEGRISYWNQGAERIYGWTAAEAMGMIVSDLLSFELPNHESARKATLETGRWEGEACTHTKAGQKILVEEDWTLVCNPAGVPQSIMVSSADITDKRALEVQTLRLQRLEGIGTLASGIAHDLNNVLTPLLLSVQLLKDKITSQQEERLLAALESNALRGARLVKQILTFGRGVKGDHALVKPEQVAQEIKQLVHDTFPKSLQFEMHAANGLWAVMGDATQLHQVLLNLAVNARDAMPKGGKLSLQLENVVLDDSYVSRHLEAKPGSYVLIAVTDNGSGIPKSIQPRIFEPFFTTKDASKRTGLGLSMCFTIIKNHGGFITCYSEPGQGSVFKVYLPADVTGAPADLRPLEPVNLPTGRGELVLIVDDEQVIREFAQITLECYGYRTLMAADGAQAVSLYNTHQDQIAVVLMDMWMPVMDGTAAIKALKSINRRVHIIGTSGLGPCGDPSVEASLTHFIAKPYTAGSLLNGLQKTLHPPFANAVPTVVTQAPVPAADSAGVCRLVATHT